MRKQKAAPKHFIAESITVTFINDPKFLKSPRYPDSFIWREEVFSITKCLSEWKDFTRKDKMARNMQPQHAQVAKQRGSWGVGRFYFEVQTSVDRKFRLVYDRAPKDVQHRNGSWILLAELET